jgi:hypothetical protein
MTRRSGRIQTLPNIIYTDGNSFSLWQDGQLQGELVRLEGDVESTGAKLVAPPTLLPLISAFLTWNPIPPRNPKRLAEIAARLCRFLRDEVIEQMARGNKGLTELATDWRKLLFPEANDAQFADGYAQAVTFGLLVARARGISLADGIEHAAGELRKSNSLIGTALRLLTDDTDNQAALATSLKTLTRVLEAVDWPTLSRTDRMPGSTSTKTSWRSTTTRCASAPAPTTRRPRWSTPWCGSSTRLCAGRSSTARMASPPLR